LIEVAEKELDSYMVIYGVPCKNCVALLRNIIKCKS